VRATVTENAPLVRSAQSLTAGEGWSTPENDQWANFSRSATSADWTRIGLEAQRTLPLDPAQAGEDDGRLPPLRVVGQIRQMYVITEGPDGLYLIDQHAAHERILYEKLLAQREAAAVVSQRLLTPLLLELSSAQAAVLEAELTALTELGFALEPFGGYSFRLLAVPEIVAQDQLPGTFLDILDEMAEGAVPLARQRHERVAIIVCKRASIKGGQTLSYQEMSELVRLLEQSENPRTCPHGRPTMIHISGHQLAREFGRH